MESTAGVFRLLLFAQRFGDRFCQLRLTRFLRQDSCVSLGYHSLSEHDNSSTGMRITQSDELSFFIMPKTKRGNTAMKGKENTDTYRCLNCGWTMPAEEQGKEPDHCPNCLLAIHEEDREGNECGGILEPGEHLQWTGGTTGSKYYQSHQNRYQLRRSRLNESRNLRTSWAAAEIQEVTTNEQRK